MDRATRPRVEPSPTSHSSHSLARDASSVSVPTETSPLIMSSESSQPAQAFPRPKATTVWQDIKAHRRAYLLTAIASFGGMLFG